MTAVCASEFDEASVLQMNKVHVKKETPLSQSEAPHFINDDPESHRSSCYPVADQFFQKIDCTSPQQMGDILKVHVRVYKSQEDPSMVPVRVGLCDPVELLPGPEGMNHCSMMEPDDVQINCDDSEHGACDKVMLFQNPWGGVEQTLCTKVIWRNEEDNGCTSDEQPEVLCHWTTMTTTTTTTTEFFDGQYREQTAMRLAGDCTDNRASGPEFGDCTTVELAGNCTLRGRWDCQHVLDRTPCDPSPRGARILPGCYPVMMRCYKDAYSGDVYNENPDAKYITVQAWKRRMESKFDRCKENHASGYCAMDRGEQYVPKPDMTPLESQRTPLFCSLVPGKDSQSYIPASWLWTPDRDIQDVYDTWFPDW